MSRELRVVRPEERDAGTAQTPGMHREAGVAGSTVGAEKLWVGHVTASGAIGLSLSTPKQ